ncbi:MarR family transcriptional regulator [Parasphingorhabdus sp.]|uniref:MarR family transcriptional regulator n=1 Tax=Parasphingorhabdus sp. TaxID=2709688 RepID=UPI003263D741
MKNRGTQEAATLAQFARNLISDRRKREALFPPLLFSDPAWDMLLDLFASEAEGKKISVTSLSIASASPQSTAQRWIDTLVDKKLILREPDPADRRRIYVRLSNSGYQNLYQYLDEISGQWGLFQK